MWGAYLATCAVPLCCRRSTNEDAKHIAIDQIDSAINLGFCVFIRSDLLGADSKPHAAALVSYRNPILWIRVCFAYWKHRRSFKRGSSLPPSSAAIPPLCSSRGRRNMDLVIKPRAKSFVWLYFGYKAGENGRPLNPDEVVCRLCRKIVCAKGNTTNLRSHLRRRHPAEFNESIGSTTAGSFLEHQGNIRLNLELRLAIGDIYGNLYIFKMLCSIRCPIFRCVARWRLSVVLLK